MKVLYCVTPFCNGPVLQSSDWRGEGDKIRQFTILGEPKGKARPRVVKGRAYTPKATKDYEDLAKFYYMREYSGAKPYDGPFVVYIKAYMGIAKSKPKKVKEELKKECYPCTKKPDADNIAKIILDALNGVAFTDDKNCVFLRIAKYYGEPARVEVGLMKYIGSEIK